MKTLLGLMAFFMLPSVTGLGSGISNAMMTKNGSQENVAYSPEAYHESNYYSIDLVVDDSLSYPSNDVRIIVRTNGYSSGVQFSVGGYYSLTSSVALDDGKSYEIHLSALYSFERVSTTITARQYSSQNGQYITRSETFYSARYEDYISLSTTSMDHAEDCAELEAFTRHGLDQAWDQEFFTYWDGKNNSRNAPFIDPVIATDFPKNTFRFHLQKEGGGFAPLRYVNVRAFNGSSEVGMYITDINGQIEVPYNMPLSFLRLESSGIDNYYMTDPVSGIHPERASGVKLCRAKDKSGDLSLYYNDFNVDGQYSRDFFISVTNSSGQVSSFGKAMRITQNLVYGKKYAEQMSGEPTNTVFVGYYPCSGERSYCKVESNPINWGATEFENVTRMYISEDAGSCPDVVLHELGHCYQYKFGFGDSLNLPHYIGIDNATSLSALDGLRLAWGEAWPTVFANLVTQQYASYFGSLDTSFNSHNCSFNLETPNVFYGQRSEEDVAAVLYDLFDNNNSSESFDRLSYGHQGLWNLMAGAAQATNGIKTFSDFLGYYQNTHSSTDNESIQKIIKQYGFSPSATANGTGTITSAPMISWSSVNGANKYEVVLYDGYGTKITTRVSYLTYYGIDDYDWKAILLSPTNNWFYEIIAYTQINGVSYGGYSSGRILMSKPSGIINGGNISINHNSSSRIVKKEINLMTNTWIKYTFRTTSNGYTTFQTVGPYGSHIELYDSLNNLVATGSGGMYGKGYGTSRQRAGFIRYICEANKDYTVLVRDCNSGRNFYGTLIVTQDHPYTAGSSSYVSAYSLNEIVTDNSYYYIECFKKRASIFNFSPLSSGGTYTIELDSDLDTYLYVVDTSTGVVYQNDDGAGHLDGKVTFEASSSWDYLIIVTQYNPSNDPSNNSDVEVHIWKN